MALLNNIQTNVENALTGIHDGVKSTSVYKAAVSIAGQSLPEDHQSTIDRFKTAYGTGFKSNLFLVKFNFLNTSTKSVLYKIMNSSKNIKLFDFNLNSLGSQSAIRHSYGIWYGLCTGFQLPELGLESSEEIDRYKTVATRKTRGSINASFLDDQWNNNREFWRLYIDNIENYGKMMYPQNYYFNVELTIMTPYDNVLTKYTFVNCYATKVPDQNLSYDSKTESGFSIDIKYTTYYKTNATIVTTNILGVKSIPEELAKVGLLIGERVINNFISPYLSKLIQDDIKEKINNKLGMQALTLADNKEVEEFIASRKI
jgi:hypothetical protein